MFVFSALFYFPGIYYLFVCAQFFEKLQNKNLLDSKNVDIEKQLVRMMNPNESKHNEIITKKFKYCSFQLKFIFAYLI